MRRWVGPVVWFGLLLGCDLALISEVPLVGVAVGVVAAGAALAVSARRLPVPVRPISLLRLPGRILVDAVRTVRGDAGGSTPEGAGRGLAELLSSASPGIFVVAHDAEPGRLTLHRLEPIQDRPGWTAAR